MFWLASLMCVFVIYGLASWLAKMMTNAGYSLASALNLLLALNVGALVGGVCAGLLADRLPIKLVLCSFYLLASMAILISGSDVPVTWLYVTTGFLGASTYGGQMLTYAYAAQLYPPARGVLQDGDDLLPDEVGKMSGRSIEQQPSQDQDE